MLQEQRNQFIESNPGFKETKTPLLLWRKFFEETREAMGAFVQHVYYRNERTRHHLGEELADVAHLLMDMATYSGINLEEAMKEKLEKDTKRFPPGSVMEKKDYRRRKVALGERRIYDKTRRTYAKI